MNAAESLVDLSLAHVFLRVRHCEMAMALPVLVRFLTQIWGCDSTSTKKIPQSPTRGPSETT